MREIFTIESRIKDSNYDWELIFPPSTFLTLGNAQAHARARDCLSLNLEHRAMRYIPDQDPDRGEKGD